MGDQSIQDAKALAHTAVRGAIAIAREMLDAMAIPPTPISTPTSPLPPDAVDAADPTGKGGVAGGAHESVVGHDPEAKHAHGGAIGHVLKKHTDDAADEPAAAPARKRMQLQPLDRAAFAVLMHFVPSQYAGAFERFNAAVVDPKKDEQPEPLVLDDISAEDEVSIQFGVGVSLIFLESVLRA